MYELYLEKEETGKRYPLPGLLPAKVTKLNGPETRELITAIDARLDSEGLEGVTLKAEGEGKRYYAEDSEFRYYEEA